MMGIYGRRRAENCSESNVEKSVRERYQEGNVFKEAKLQSSAGNPNAFLQINYSYLYYIPNILNMLSQGANEFSIILYQWEQLQRFP